MIVKTFNVLENILIPFKLEFSQLPSQLQVSPLHGISAVARSQRYVPHTKIARMKRSGVLFLGILALLETLIKPAGIIIHSTGLALFQSFDDTCLEA